MATTDSLTWQQSHIIESRRALNYDLRSAADESDKLGRPLTEAEFEAFRLDQVPSLTPIRPLVYVGD